MHKNPTLEKSDLYDFKMAVSDNGKPQEFLLFIFNLNITIKVSGTLNYGVKIQCFCTLVCGEALCQFYGLSAEVESVSPESLTYIILGLDVYFPPVNVLSNQTRAICRKISEPRCLKSYSAPIIWLALMSTWMCYLGEI